MTDSYSLLATTLTHGAVTIVTIGVAVGVLKNDIKWISKNFDDHAKHDDEAFKEIRRLMSKRRDDDD
jgi:hypothetical protein